MWEGFLVQIFWWKSWGWRRLHRLLLNFFINNLDGLASPCKHWDIGLSLNFSLHYYAPNQYVNLYGPLALGEGCIRRDLYPERRPTFIFWETDWEPGLSKRQKTLSLWLIPYLFIIDTFITANRPFCLKSRQECPEACLCSWTVCLSALLPPALISYHLLGALALSPALKLLSLSLNKLLTDIHVGVNNRLQLYVFSLMGIFTC